MDVRLISAGRVDVLELTRTRVFREDLYYRLSPVKLRIPDLAERREDIPALTHSFLENKARTLAIPCPEPSEEFMARLYAYAWPGNVRELHNALCHALVFLEPGRLTLEADMLPDHLLQESSGPLPPRGRCMQGRRACSSWQSWSQCARDSSAAMGMWRKRRRVWASPTPPYTIAWQKHGAMA